MYFVDAANKKDLLIHILKDKSIATALVFTRTKHGADKVQRMLEKAHIKAEAIHGNKSQNARQNALRNFKDRTTRVLVATDIAARGIDIDDLNLVINYEIPNIPETYVHRIGRTGRAGLEGKAVSFCDAEEFDYLRDIQKLISIQIPVVTDHPYPGEILPLIGAKKAKAKNKPTSSVRTSGRGTIGGSKSAGNNEDKIARPSRPQSSRPPLSHTPKSDSAPKKYWGK
jgi:ATP-dependent RNA helicase RhlE